MNQKTAPSSAKLATSRRQRSTPYTPRVESLGVSDYSVVNHTILPKGFGRSVEDDYWHLKKYVQLWDVSCQRQVSLRGPAGALLAQLMTPRDLRNVRIGQCLYAPMTDEMGGILNDPIILKLAKDHFWFSIADSDVLLWAKGLSLGLDLDVTVHEPDVSPLAIQGPRSDEIMVKVFGEKIKSIPFFGFDKLDFQGRPLIIARTGYSKQGGFEIYLDDFNMGTALWDAIWAAGQDSNIRAGSPNLIERVEGGLLSYGNEMTLQNNPLECGLGRFCQLDGSLEYIGRDALVKINESGPQRIIRGIVFDGTPCPPCTCPWPLTVNGLHAGQATTAIWSPRFQQNIALAMVEQDYWQPGQPLQVDCGDETTRNGMVMSLPFEESEMEKFDKNERQIIS